MVGNILIPLDGPRTAEQVLVYVKLIAMCTHGRPRSA
jgi:hypothetical protein